MRKVRRGDGATVGIGSDKYGATVIDWDGKYITVQMDDVVRIDDNGISESQEYEYTRNPDGSKITFKLGRHNWVPVILNPDTGRWNNASHSGYKLYVGYRQSYYDFSF